MSAWSTLKSLFHRKNKEIVVKDLGGAMFHEATLRAAAGIESLLTRRQRQSAEEPKQESMLETVADAPVLICHRGKMKELQEGGGFDEQDLPSLSLSSFVGQEGLKNNLRTWLVKVDREEQPFPHLLLCGPPEVGKKTLVFALAQEVGVNVIVCHPSVLQLQRPGNLAVMFTNLDAGDFVLLEEIDSLNKTVLSFLLSAIEDGTMDLVVGQGPSARKVTLDLNRFSLIGTTSKPFQVDKRLRRWLITYDFAPYTVEQISEIFQFLARQQGGRVDPAAARLLADYCEGTVGNARVLLKRVGAFARSSQEVTYEIAQEALQAFYYLEQPATSMSLANKLVQMTGVEFEEFVAAMFRKEGYVVELTPGSGDHGIDLMLRKDNQLSVVQCKRWTAPIGEPVVRDFFGALMNIGAQSGYIITTSAFTSQALTFAQNKPIRLIDLAALLDLHSSHR
ncbi:MAG: restriction endonuclease [Candidatus Binatia bacterium]